jgi:leader peptidase (prepilin peptidase)/N-methyltransferase
LQQLATEPERILDTSFITQQPNLVIAAIYFLFGLVFGSFLNVCIYRLPRELSVVSPRSACPNCGAPIAFYDNIPVLSWVILRGRCRNCGARISPRYAIVELVTGLLFALSFYSASSGPESIKLSAFCFLIVGLIFTDAETHLLPDLLTKPGIVAGLIFSLWVPLRDGPAMLLARSLRMPPLISLLNSLAGAILGSAFILCVAVAYEALRGEEGMGRGDVKLMALIGAFLGVKLTLLVLLLGSLVGSIFGMALMVMVWFKRMARRRQRHPDESASERRTRAWYSARLVYRHFEIPFGVFLGIAALVAAFAGQRMIDWYFGLYRLHG